VAGEPPPGDGLLAAEVDVVVGEPDRGSRRAAEYGAMTSAAAILASGASHPGGAWGRWPNGHKELIASLKRRPLAVPGVNETLTNKLKEVRHDWRDGRSEGDPCCCIAAYCWDRLWSLPPSMTRCVGQGVEPENSSFDWVPCGLSITAARALPHLRRLQRIVAFWYSARRPGSAVSRRRGDYAPGPRRPWLRPAQEVRFDLARARGPMEAAFAELDAERYDPELNWS
jgi:hypothetical protein